MTGTLDVVTGAFSFTGRHIADLLLARGRAARLLTRRPPASDDPLAGRVAVAPLRFDEWLNAHGAQLGRSSTSELLRNFARKGRG